MLVAIRALRQQEPARIVVAVPTAAPSVCAEIGRECDEIICAITPEPFYAVGLWYDDFSETTDDDVRRLLEHARIRPEEFHEDSTENDATGWREP
jgi:predicted phosphoribosyltransferase